MSGPAALHDDATWLLRLGRRWLRGADCLAAGRLCVAGLVAVCSLHPGAALAAGEPGVVTSADSGAEESVGSDKVNAEALDAEPGLFLHGYVVSSVGDGLRLNNPYRLAQPLGDDAESLSRSAAYVNLAGGLLFGDPLGWQHGAQLDLSFAVEGIPQETLATSYVLYRHLNALFSAYGRLGLPLVLEPDVSLGVELGAGGLLALRGGLALSFELIYAQFYGAATQDESVTVIPIVAAQLGLRASYEVLP